jgi:3-oxoadipate enol-lactonase
MLLATATHRIHYDLIGPSSGAVVCFAHAVLADGGMWADQVTALVGAGLQALRIDMRGHGGSEGTSTPCSVEDLAHDVIAVLDQLGLDRVHLVGLSIGGVIGQFIATRYPDRLLSLVLSDTNVASAPNAKAMWSERVALVKQAGSPACLADGMMGRLLSENFKGQQPVRWRQIYETIKATRPEGVFAGANALQDFDFTSALPSVKTRTLVLCGAKDPATPPSEAKKIVDLIPGAKYHEIADALHFPNVERADVYSKVLLEWLAAKRWSNQITR